MDKPESRGDGSGKEPSKKRAAVSTDGDRTLEEERTGVSSNMRCLEDIFVLLCRVIEDVEAEMEHLVRARDVTDGATLPLGW